VSLELRRAATACGLALLAVGAIVILVARLTDPGVMLQHVRGDAPEHEPMRCAQGPPVAACSRPFHAWSFDNTRRGMSTTFKPVRANLEFEALDGQMRYTSNCSNTRLSWSVKVDGRLIQSGELVSTGNPVLRADRAESPIAMVPARVDEVTVEAHRKDSEPCASTLIIADLHLEPA